MIKTLLALLAVVAVTAWWLAPPAQRTLPPLANELSEPVRGAFHVHTARSDGTGTTEQVAAAAAAAGLKFVVLTDHGDGNREVSRPQYVSGVLMIEAPEISTDGGHVIALEMARSTYPLGGEPRDVVEDIRRLGGFPIAAHPGSEKPELRWTDWDVPVGGLEWLNGDSEWRDESRWRLARALFTYPVRHAESLATLLDRPDDVLRRWDALTMTRRVVGLAAADAHARIGLRTLGEPYDNGSSFHLPTYEDSFRAFSVSLPQIELTGSAEPDAKGVTAAIRAGHVYSTIDAVGGHAAVRFMATSGERRAMGGDQLMPGGPVLLRADVQAPADARIVLIKNGSPVSMANGTTLEYMASGEDRAAYRLEVQLPDAPGEPPVPWIVTNPIYVGGFEPVASGPPQAPVRPARANAIAVQYANGPASGWVIEKSAASLAALDVVPAVPGTQLFFRYALGGTKADSPFAAAVMPAGSQIGGYDRLVFTARSDRPTRLSVQLRVPNGPAGERWHRSVYLDATARTFTIPFNDFTPSGPTSQPRPVLAAVESVLFVIDTVNANVGASGQIWIDDVGYGKEP